MCAGAWVLRVFMVWDSIFVRRHVGFEGFRALGFNFCAQARGFYRILLVTVRFLCAGAKVLRG